ncbi:MULTISPECIES: hypothetical protein [Vibrio]|uniref:hypothetical protein n=1 Tax=Vibrio TaxID=662 RepID=UPI003D112EE0
MKNNLAIALLFLTGCNSIAPEHQGTYQLCTSLSQYDNEAIEQELINRGVDPKGMECDKARVESQKEREREMKLNRELWLLEHKLRHESY